MAFKETATRIKNSDLPSHLAKLKQQHENTGLNDDQWENFRLSFKGDVEQILSSEILKSDKIINSLTGAVVKEADPDKLNISLIQAGAELSKQPYNLLKVELSRLEKLIGIDKENALKLKNLSEKIAKEEITCSNLEKEIADAESSGAKISELVQARKNAYKQIFEALLDHQKILESLYKPLQSSLEDDSGSLKKMTFHVQRSVNVESWAEKGEKLLDLRKGSAFRNGKLLEIAKEKLLPSWQSGSPDEVSNAMEKFLEEHRKNFEEHSPAPKNDLKLFREWANKISEWLYGTSHISIEYGVQYDDVSIQQLSPGTRGIVLLLLYLAIDKEDYRPLIIDQPEENLDPKSIYDELVEKFRKAKLRRQIIIVTHNANLVVNTDADQVIVASCGSHKPNQLPTISYTSGSLENPEIRKKVCEILEGGEIAFRERAKRLRLSL